MKAIRSRDNAFVKQLIGLAHSSRDRKKAGLTVLDGIHLVRAYHEALGATQSLVIAESALDDPEVVALLQDAGNADINVLSDALLKEASALESPSMVMAIVPTPSPQPVAKNANAILLLEDVQDPGNVGSMLRSAAAAGISDVLLSKTSAFAWSPKVLRAGQGAHFAINIIEGVDLIAWLKDWHQQKGTQSLALAPLAKQTLYDCDLRQPTAFLVGNEGAGLSAELLSAASLQVSIPMPGKIESLNAAAAAAVCLFELTRQRQRKS
ncbi:MAG TPA: RNA methyltransferase [Usitatibacteraceae bacterium]